MSNKELTDKEVEEELERTFKLKEAQKNHCGTALPSSRETGLQIDKVKMKKK
ncbi:MAG: hypothetical protein KAX10_04600 [Candidatus Lokiarchaeota archaeon]|nr:hypothetical protein [Candidatus Lokiarchaeota archaeon]